MTHADLPSSHGLIERGLGKSHAIWTIAMVGAVFALQSSVTALVLSPDALSFGSEATQVSQADAATTAGNTKAQALNAASNLKMPVSDGAVGARASSSPASESAARGPAAVASNSLSPTTTAGRVDTPMAEAGTTAVSEKPVHRVGAVSTLAQSSGDASVSGRDSKESIAATASATSAAISAEKTVTVAESAASTKETSVVESGSAESTHPVAVAKVLPTPRSKPAHLVRKASVKNSDRPAPVKSTAASTASQTPTMKTAAKPDKATKAVKASVVKTTPKAKPAPIAKSTGIRPTGKQLRRLPGDYLTLQLISLKDDAYLDAFAKRFGFQAEQARIKVKKSDGVRHVLVHGTFANRGDADRVAGQIYKLYGVKPWVRRIEDLRQELSAGA